MQRQPAVRYEHANGLTMFSVATRQRGVSTRVGNVIHGRESPPVEPVAMPGRTPLV